MSKNESDDAMREAAQEIIDHPEQTPKYEEALRRYLSSAAYREKRQEARDDTSRDKNAGAEGAS